MQRVIAPHLRRLGARMGFHRDWYLYLAAAVIGLIMGLLAIAFIWPLRQSEHFAESLSGAAGLWWMVLLLPAAGGLITGILITVLKSDGAGPGVTAVIYAVHRQKARMPLRVGIRKWLASTATIGSGGSAGAEGPIVTIGAAAGSAVARLLGTGSQHTGTLLGCGAAAGLASVFNAPIAGVFFVMELLLRDFSLRTFAPIVIAAVVSSATTQGILGDAAIFNVDSAFFHHAVGFSASQIPAYLVLGLVCGLLGAVFVRALDFTERTFAKSSLPLATRPIVGALLLGVLGVAALWFTGSDTVPGFYGNGYPTIKSLLSLDLYYQDTGKTVLAAAGPFLLAIGTLTLIKIAATCLTVGSGGAGGLFAPSLLVGAGTGAIIGYFVSATGWFPGASPAHFALIGMAAMVAATTHAPLTAILIVYEVTQTYEVILPLMFAGVVGTIVSRIACRESVYTFRLSRMGVRMGAMSDLTILRRLSAQDVVLIDPAIVQRDDSAQKLLDLSETSRAIDFIVVDEHEHYCGMVTAGALREALVYRESIPLLQVYELQRSDLPTVTPEETLDVVLDKFSRSDVESLTVLDDRGERIRGLITRSNLMRRYQSALDEDASE